MMPTAKKEKRGRPRLYGKRDALMLRLEPELVNTDPGLSMNQLLEMMVRHWLRERDAGRLRPMDLFAPKNGGD
jgi:hypothetical protein